MIPALMILGLAFGMIPRRWPNRTAIVVALCALAAVGWGLMVAEDGMVQVFYGAVIAGINLALGVAFAEFIAWTLRRTGENDARGVR